MNTVRCWLSFLLVVYLIVAAEVTADILPGNFLENPSFEIDDDGDGIPDGWLRGGNNPSGDLWEDEQPVSGDYHLTLLDESDSSYTSWYTNVELPEDIEEVTFQWHWSYLFTSDNPGDEFRLTIAWRSEGRDVSFDHFVVREDQPEYVKENMEFLVPPDVDALRLEFVTAGPQLETGMMWIDDVSIAPVGAELLGDFNGNGQLDADDIDRMSAAIRQGDFVPRFDIDGDGTLSDTDRRSLVFDVFNTWIGDANLDGEHDSADLVSVFVAGEYEDNLVGNSTWATGDWNGDGEFDSGDFVEAFQYGCYESRCGNVPRPAEAAVPEPTSGAMFAICFGAFAAIARSRRLDLAMTS